MSDAKKNSAFMKALKPSPQLAVIVAPIRFRAPR
jgi:hypothetical protein